LTRGESRGTQNTMVAIMKGTTNSAAHRMALAITGTLRTGWTRRTVSKFVSQWRGVLYNPCSRVTPPSTPCSRGYSSLTMTVDVSCPACEARSVSAVEGWAVGGGQQAMACHACGILFTYPPPSPEVLQGYYASDGDWQSAHAAKRAKAQTKTKRAAPALMSVLDRFFPATQPRAGSRVFDFGCGSGAWLNSFQNHGWLTYGLEPSTDVAFVRHERLTSVPTDGRFDLVIVWHVLEHLPRPVDMLRTLAAAIAPGGYCLVSVPRVDTLAVHRDLPYVLRPPAHVVAYTEACLRGLMASCGLETVTALHELDGAFSKGAPLRLRLLAQNGGPPGPRPSPGAALAAVFDAVAALSGPVEQGGSLPTE
jgi:SAM-dependent methyltransferase